MLATNQSIDAIGLEVMKHSFMQICEESSISLLKTAHSVIFNEGKDIASVVCDPDARLIAQDMTASPFHLGAIPFSIQAGLRHFADDGLQDGDVVIINDTFAGGTHLPDITLFAPVFLGDELLGYIGNRGHHNDVGGMAPGSMPGDATDMFQEGLALPPVKLLRAGERNEEVWDIILRNVRLPDTTEGDLSAQLAGVRTGALRFRELAQKVGVDYLRRSTSGLIEYSERQMRAEIAAIPDGTYEFTDYMDPLPTGGEPFPIHVAATVQGDDIVLDFAGTAPQVRAAINTSLSVTICAVRIAILMVTDPGLHPSDGSFAPIKIVAPEGSLLNARRPASTVSGLTETSNRVHDVVFGALAQAIPERVTAGKVGSCNVYTLAGERAGSASGAAAKQWVALLNPKGGWGARRGADGYTATQDPISNCRLQPVEALEKSYPLRVHRLELRTGPEGAGEFRGGYGLRRDIEVLSECTLSTSLDRAVIPPFGLEGGHVGAPNEMSLRLSDSDEWVPCSPRRSNLPLHAGDVVRIETAIGGGFGVPACRDRVDIQRDVDEGYITRAQADRVYGATMSAAGGTS